MAGEQRISRKTTRSGREDDGERQHTRCAKTTSLPTTGGREVNNGEDDIVEKSKGSRSGKNERKGAKNKNVGGGGQGGKEKFAVVPKMEHEGGATKVPAA